jgi:hypothetical protein
MFRLPVYAPNVPKPQLGERLLAQLEGLIEVRVLPSAARVAFRAPELDLLLPTDRVDDLLPVLAALLEVARTLGGTQFQIRHNGFAMRPRSTAIAGDELERLMIASLGFEIEQVDIF